MCIYIYICFIDYYTYIDIDIDIHVSLYVLTLKRLPPPPRPPSPPFRSRLRPCLPTPAEWPYKTADGWGCAVAMVSFYWDPGQDWVFSFWLPFNTSKKMDPPTKKRAAGQGSKPMVSHFGVGEFTTHFRTYFSWDWDVHWGYDLDFDPWPCEWWMASTNRWLVSRKSGNRFHRRTPGNPTE